MSGNAKMSDPRWFRNPMVWLVIFFPSLAVVAGLATVMIAVKTDDGLVVDDYYKKGLEINQVINHDRKARELGLRALVDVNTLSGELLVSLSSEKSTDWPAEVTFKLIHRTRSGEDQTTVLSRVGDSNDYRGYLKPPIIEGRWTIQILSGEIWRLKQNFTTQTAEHLLINIAS